MLGRRRQHVLLPSGRPAAQRGLVEADDMRQRDQRLDHCDDLGHRGRAPGQHAVHEPARGSRPASQVSDQLDAAGHRHVLVDQQIHRQRLEVHPIARRRRRHLARQHRDMLSTAAAADPVHVVLPHLDTHQRQVVHLVGVLDADIVRLGQVRPAPAAALRAVRHPLIRCTHPRQRAAPGTGLLAPPAPRALHPLRYGPAPARKIVAGRRHRGVPAVTPGHPLQPPHPLLQRRVRLPQTHDHPGLLPGKRDQLPARQLLQPGHNARSSQLAAQPTHRHAEDQLPT